MDGCIANVSQCYETWGGSRRLSSYLLLFLAAETTVLGLRCRLTLWLPPFEVDVRAPALAGQTHGAIPQVCITTLFLK